LAVFTQNYDLPRVLYLNLEIEGGSALKAKGKYTPTDFHFGWEQALFYLNQRGKKSQAFRF